MAQSPSSDRQSSSQGPQGQTVDRARNFAIRDFKDGFDILKGVSDIVRGVSKDPVADTFQITINDVYPDTDRTHVYLVVEVRNVSPHGVYIEEVWLEQNQTREGNDAARAAYTINVFNNEGLKKDYVPWTTPIRLAQTDTRSLRIDISLSHGTWPVADAYGVLVFRVTKLQNVAPSIRGITFAIRK